MQRGSEKKKDEKREGWTKMGVIPLHLPLLPLSSSPSDNGSDRAKSKILVSCLTICFYYLSPVPYCCGCLCI